MRNFVLELICLFYLFGMNNSQFNNNNNNNEFYLKTKDNVQIAVKKWNGLNVNNETKEEKNILVIFVHQYAIMGGNSQLMAGMARRINKYGYDAITFDLRGAGRSTGKSSYTNSNELVDLQTVVDYVLETTNQKIFLVGSSGGAPLVGATLDYSDRIIGGFLIGYVWGFWASILFGWAYKSIQNSPKPKLFVIGTNDEFTTMSQYEYRISQLAGKINERKIIQDKNHFEIEAPVYDQQMVEWIIEFIDYITTTTPSFNECSNK